MYKSDKNSFDQNQLADMEQRKFTASNIRTPDELKDKIVPEGMENFDEENLTSGGKLFNIFCSVCHQRNGRGNDRFPPLGGTDWVTGDKATLIGVVLNLLSGEITVKGKSYTNRMPKLHMLKDDEIADILTYIRQSFGNNASAITPDEVTKVRGSN
jgi:mono/diheme cytochrome c family protein